MFKIVFSALAGLSLTVAAALPAHAEVSQFSSNGNGVARSDGKAALGGRIKCASSESFRVWVRLRRDGQELKGVSARKSCHGGPQTWKALAESDVHKAAAGRWQMCAVPFDTRPDREPTCGMVTLRKG